MRPATLQFSLAITLIIGLRLASLAEENHDIFLPKPELDTGKTFMRAVEERKTSREFARSELAHQTLGNLLWAAFGINRPGNAHRTAPSAMNAQEIDIYVALPQGVYIYDASLHRLMAVQTGDLRPGISSQPYCTNAGVVLMYVANKARMTKAKPEMRSFYAAFDAGCICQNVYLYCASAGLGSVVFDLARPPVAEALKFSPDQEIIMAQSVGTPKPARAPSQPR